MSAPRSRVWFGCLLGVTLAGLGGGAVWISRNWPFTRSAVTQTLEERFAREVTIGQFRETWFPPGCVAGDVRFLHRQRKDLPPLITAKNIVITASWAGLLARRIGKIKLVDLHVTVPPPNVSGKSPVMPITDSKSKLSGVSEIEANDAVLVFLPRYPGDRENTFHVHQLVLEQVGGGHTIPFRVSMKTDQPSGELTASGKLGPWKTNATGETPLSGTYRFADADLSVFHGLRGILSAQGDFTGTMDRVAVDGATDVPQFHVDGSAHTVHFSARYQASVDGQTADTVIQHVEAHVGRTVILANGNISGGKGTEGKTARVQLAVDTGRVEDLLNYFSDEQHAAMTGATRVRAYVEVPPGPGFLKKIRLDGDFGVGTGKFTNATRQEPINHLGESARGEKKEQQEEDPRTVLFDLKGHVSIRGGSASLRNISFDFPGSQAQMTGSYNLLARTVDLHGILRTDGTLSDSASGFKSLMLKIATPFFRKQHTTAVPFAITGPASHPSIGLDLNNRVKL